MIPDGISPRIPLASRTTLGVGGAAQFFLEAHSEEEVRVGIAFAEREKLPLVVLGNGSNLLVPDTGVAGVVLHMSIKGIEVAAADEGVSIVAGAGTAWDVVVDAASAQGVFDIANLAGIPGSLGGAAVQNIGAYGAEFSQVFAYAEVIERTTGATRRVSREEAAFAYRTSLFKTHREYLITRVALRLTERSKPNLAYNDLARASGAGVPLRTPSEVAAAVRDIRAAKFPQASDGGTAGSFFKNPIITREQAEELGGRFPGLPAYPQADDRVKVSLAWLLDHALGLKGYTKGKVRLYEKQPIVIVARAGATAAEIDDFAHEIAKKVFEATHITIEREVEMFGA